VKKQGYELIEREDYPDVELKRIVDGVQVTIAFVAKAAELPPGEEKDEEEEED